MGSFSFAQVPIADIPRSVFDRSHSHKTTFDAGYLIPFYIDEALPGDTFSLNASVFGRLATPVVPVMDNLRLDVFFFAVPNRLVWDNWQKMMGEQLNPGDSTDYLVPQVANPVGGHAFGSLFDYFGMPTEVSGVWCSALYPRAYNLIWNEWFRDENLQTRAVVDKDDGPDTVTDYVLRRRGKRHDYFTSCLPWPQKGTAVDLPLGTTAPLIAQGDNQPTFVFGASAAAPLKLLDAPAATNRDIGIDTSSSPAQFTVGTWGDPKLAADLTSATAATINQLREAFQIQKLLERDARGGTRYVEILRAHFGVVSPDQRLQRPEYLGGGSVPITVNPVTQTSSTDATTPQGNLAAFGVVGGSGFGFSKSFVEHCVILGLCMVRADLSYQQGLPRMLSRRTRYDFYWPALAHLGEQAVLNKEIYAQGIAADNEVFGYQERWSEYRYFPSKITGKFRSTYATPLDVWHLAQEFSALPTLGSTFIEENPPMSRILAVTTEPHILFDCDIRLKCARPMPTYSVPGLIDHF